METLKGFLPADLGRVHDKNHLNQKALILSANKRYYWKGEKRVVRFAWRSEQVLQIKSSTNVSYQSSMQCHMFIQKRVMQETENVCNIIKHIEYNRNQLSPQSAFVPLSQIPFMEWKRHRKRLKIHIKSLFSENNFQCNSISISFSLHSVPFSGCNGLSIYWNANSRQPLRKTENDSKQNK